MAKIKRIAVISTHSFGYIDFLVEKLNESEKVDLTYINVDRIPFSYKNMFYKIYNFVLKIFFFPSLKEQNKTNFIINSIGEENSFDQTLIIRPDKLERKALVFLRKNSVVMNCFLFDGIENFKNQKKTLSFFDTVYSYDKKDVEKYKFQFLTNYIYDDTIQNNEIVNKVFNISSYDRRFPFLEKVADYLAENSISFRFVIKKDKAFDHKNIEIITEYLPISDVKKIIAGSLVLVDVQKENQYGLSFRIFEALGYKRKLITNNQDIVTYDFYNENNVFVISDKNYEIPLGFFETEYLEIAPEILDRYKLKNWISQVFGVD